MGKNSPLNIKEVPDFIYNVLSSNYVANFLGFYIPNFYDIREFLIDRLETIELGFIRLSFCNFDEKQFLEGFEDKVTLDDIKQLLYYLLKHFSEIKDFFKNKDEQFYIELHFQLPFIHKSMLKSKDRKRLLSQKKVRYYNTFRQYLRGVFLIIQEEEVDTAYVLKGDYLFKNIAVSDKDTKFYLAYPSQLKDYWSFVLEHIM